MVKIFVDDIRVAPDKYDLVFRSGEELLEWLKVNVGTEVELLSLDHDLDEGYMDGTQLCRELVEMNPRIKAVQFHTDNYEGLKNMYSIWKSAHKVGVLPRLKHLNPYKVVCIDGNESEMRMFDARKQR